MIGVISTSEALKLAFASGLDLVEISPTANPPVCRIMNFGKFKYEESRKEKMERRQQAGGKTKEFDRFHANIEEHDYQTKLRQIREFLEKGCRIKATLRFRGRENEHRELGFELFKRLIKDCEPVGVAEFPPKLFGNSLVLLLRSQTSGKKPEAPPKPAPPP